MTVSVCADSKTEQKQTQITTSVSSVLEPCSSSKPCSYDLTDCTHEAHCSKTQVLMNDDDDCLGNMVYPSEDVAYREEHPGQTRGPFLLTGFLQTTLKCLSVSFQS